jgi:hypothetical protein
MGVVSVKFLLCTCCKLVVLKVSRIWTMGAICLFLNLEYGGYMFVSESGL